MNLHESSRIKRIFKEAERLIQVGTHELTEDIGVQKMGPLLKTLKAMEKICTASNVYNRASYSTEQVSQSLVSKSVYFAYSNEEENWLTKQLNTFEVSYYLRKLVFTNSHYFFIRTCTRTVSLIYECF